MVLYFDPSELPWASYIPSGKDLLNGWQSTILLYVGLWPLAVLALYAAHKIFALLRFLWVYFGPLDYKPKPGVIPEGEEPIVSVLISCYNEAQVIRRTIDAACNMDWPADKLEVCILDDSTDVTKEITDEAATEWQERGINCRVIRRPNREGYKAGNLAYAQDMITGNYHAMFDADHIATKDFLRKTMVHFYDKEGNSKEEIGLVQTPWGYYNINSNMLTQCDALMLDVHHVIEQRGRSRALGMFSFNGTGGVWRKEAIQSGGGWTWDTVTEDLDLSYRACLNGFRFVYVEDGPCGLEIPANISAFKSQKYRWDQGYAQVTKKSLTDLLTYPGATLSQKIEVFFHLTGGIQYPMTLWILLFVPVLSYFELMTLWALYAMGGIVFVIIVQITLAIVLKPSYKGDYTGCSRLIRYFYLIPSMMLNIGMSVNATMAVFAGYFKEGAVFIRTPKEGCDGGGATVPALEEMSAASSSMSASPSAGHAAVIAPVPVTMSTSQRVLIVDEPRRSSSTRAITAGSVLAGPVPPPASSSSSFSSSPATIAPVPPVVGEGSRRVVRSSSSRRAVAATTFSPPPQSRQPPTQSSRSASGLRAVETFSVSPQRFHTIDAPVSTFSPPLPLPPTEQAPAVPPPPPTTTTTQRAPAVPPMPMQQQRPQGLTSQHSGFMMAPTSTIPTVEEVQAAEDAAAAAANGGVSSADHPTDPVKPAHLRRESLSIYAAKKKFVEERRKRRKLPQYETKMDLKVSTVVEFLLAIYFIVCVLIMLPSIEGKISAIELAALLVPAISFFTFSVTALCDYTKHRRRIFFQNIRNVRDYLSYYILCCCLCPRVDKPTFGPFETFEDEESQRCSNTTSVSGTAVESFTMSTARSAPKPIVVNSSTRARSPSPPPI